MTGGIRELLGCWGYSMARKGGWCAKAGRDGVSCALRMGVGVGERKAGWWGDYGGGGDAEWY
jgi:hypothetical protein